MSSPLTPRVRGAYQAFTLIELLTVIAIIGILAGITFGVIGGVRKQANVAKAKSELAALSQALEAYKRLYGDYPQTGRSDGNLITAATDSRVEGQLFNALLGKIGPKLDNIQGRQFTEASKFTVQDTDPSQLPTAGNSTAVDNAFVDPWGNLYLYYYRTTAGGGWVNPSYILFSAGPDRQHDVSVSNIGVLTEGNAVVDADNLYADKL